MTLRPLEKTHTGVPEMSTFKTHPPAPSRSTSPFFPVPWLFSGEASGHLARVLGGSSPSCPLFQGTREGGKGPTVGLDLGFPAAKPAKGPVHKEAGDPSVGWAAPALLVWTPAWVWGGGRAWRACLGGSQHMLGHPHTPTSPPWVEARRGSGTNQRTQFCMQKSAGWLGALGWDTGLPWGNGACPHKHHGGCMEKSGTPGGRGEKLHVQN